MNSIRLASFVSLFLLASLNASPLAGQDSERAVASWDVEAPPGPSYQQEIDVNEGTWISLDVSPDGQHIVFDLLGDIYLMPIGGADGSRGVYPQQLTSGMSWDMQPRFSPDGQWIAFTSDRTGSNKKGGDNIWTMDDRGEQVKQVTNESYRLLNGPAWSPDGEYLVARKHFTSRRSLGAGEMWMYHRSALDAQATGGVQLTKKPTDEKDVNEPAFSPDGKHLYYSEDVWPGTSFEYDKDSNKQIYVVKRLDLDSGETETVISGPGGACRPTPSPSGQQIAFVRRIGAKTGLHLFDVKSGAVRLVYDELERDMQETWAIHGVYPAFAWMPDETAIVAWAKGKIRKIDLNSGTATVIPFQIKGSRRATKALRFDIAVAPSEFEVKLLQHVQWTPDQQHVVFQALGHVYIRDRMSGNELSDPRRLTSQTDHFEFMPSVSRDGKYVTYVAWDDERLGSVRVASLDRQDLETWTVTEEAGHFRNPVFSPDGSTIVFEKRGGGMLTSPLWSHQPGLYRVSARGGSWTRISKSGSSPRFGRSNDRVYFLKSSREKSADNLGLYSVNLLDGAEPRQHYTSTWATDYVLSQDGAWIAFVERFHVYVAPFVRAGGVIHVGPGASNLPVVKVSQEAGQGIQFSADSRQLSWSLGPRLYTANLNGLLFDSADPKAARSVEAKPPAEDASPAKDSKAASVTTTSKLIGFQHSYAAPTQTLALVGGRLLTMEDSRPIDNGVILIQGNRITDVGPRGRVKIPQGAKTIDLQGRVVLPGLIDTHAHGSQGSGGVIPQRSWINYARLAFGVTTIHDPSNDTNLIFAASELAKAGLITAPRTFSTGTILYGATSAGKAEIDSIEDAKFHLRRMKAVGAFSVKSYNQPRRDQRQQVVAAARELGMMVVPEGGATFMHNMSMIVDGHTGIEHTLSVQTAYDDVLDLWRNTGVGYTPTLCVAYGGISGEQYWYQVDDLWLHPRLKSFTPPHVLQPRSRRRNLAPDEDYNHIRVAKIAKQRVDDGGLVQAGGHGQLNGICTHWELWSFVQGGMTPMQALQCGTINGARYLGLDKDLGSISTGKLADLIIIEKGADPAKDIRQSERIEWVVANGRVFDAKRMNEHGAVSPRAPFYWERSGYGGVSTAMPRARGCGCERPGGPTRWAQP